MLLRLDTNDKGMERFAEGFNSSSTTDKILLAKTKIKIKIGNPRKVVVEIH